MSDGAAQRVRIEIVDGVADVRLNRPDKMNAIDPAMFAALVEAGEHLSMTRGLRAVVLSGEGTAFSAGLDMASFAAMASSEGGGSMFGDLAERTHGAANAAQHVALVWRRLPVPVIAAIQGAAFGGGLQIALGADIRYATPDARLSVMEIKWGLVPDMAGVLLMRDLARADVVRDVTFTGRVFSGSEAATLGFVTRVEAAPRAAALETAREIARKSPDAIRAAKRLLNIADEEIARKILLAESVEQKALIGSANQVEAVQANLARRPPVFNDPEP
ncbi:MAG TPA: crotonase/enoyl-CoA hydratase family protein [Acetobacteraceae bacterium]|nr:crotonase/enoyl-CoA hydratase family protein [Acetobacteraceae bacterium]